MVQVDVFWSFGLGAGFAAAASRQIKMEDKPFESKYFVKTLVYLSVFFVPSGATLLWGFPEWETMQAGRYSTIPAWLVTLFTLTNVTQGILGFYLAWRLIRAGNAYGAYVITILAYFCMFFILVHGWDGTGYQRFFFSCSFWDSPGRCADLWAPGKIHFFKWLVSPVALTLYALGVVMLPLLFYWMADWAKTGYELGDVDTERAAQITKMEMTLVVMRLVFLHALGGAIVASFFVRYMGWWMGLIGFFALYYAVCLRKGGLTWKTADKILLSVD